MILSLLACILFACGNKNTCENYQVTSTLRAPAYPLITIDPYTSGWSFTDKLYDQSVKHWTGHNFPLIGAIRVDGNVYRFMGAEEVPTQPIVKTSEQGAWEAKYVFEKPAAGWDKKDFNDSNWKKGAAAFGTPHNEPTAKTSWYGEHIWVRRTFELAEDLAGKQTVYLEYSHDDDVEIYINGIEVVNTGNACKKNVMLKLSEEVIKSLVKGENVIAAHCWNRGGNALLDFGICMELPLDRQLEQTAVQKSVEVLPTRTIYTFTCGAVDLMLTFTAPMLMDNLDLLSRPVNYISYKVTPNDGQAHDVELYLEAGTAWALDKVGQESESEIVEKDNMFFLKTGSTAQKVLVKYGDDVRIDWGYFFLSGDKSNTTYGIGNSFAMRSAFGTEGKVVTGTATDDGQDNLALSRSLGSVAECTQGYFMLGYDDLYSIQYFGDNLRPYWNRKGDKDIYSIFDLAVKEYDSLMDACKTFDKKMMKETTEVGGKEYAELCALAYRQAISAHKLVEAPNGDLLFLSKENFSNGSIGTVDVTYPSAPLFLYYNPELVKGLMNHIFYYSESGRWTKPFPAHDVGTYPLANGQTYGDDMPVEESGNMLALTAAVAAREGNADYAAKHWDVLTIWADYLVEKGLDPENQLCTDDFAGHFAHNTNLSVKAIMGIASYGKLAGMLGKKDIAEKYTAKAREMAIEWEKMANDGDHYRLTFDQPGTWSQKYNIVWDKLMDMNIFPKQIVEKEIAYYLTKQNKYGLPLDNRETYTKSDWVIWTATLAPDKATFQQLVTPVHKFMNETVTRVPMTDWYWTDSPNQRGFQARSVVGGYYIKMLEGKLTK